MRLPRFRKRTLFFGAVFLALSLTALVPRIREWREEMRVRERNALWSQEASKHQRDLHVRVSKDPTAALLDEPSPGKRAEAARILGQDAARRKLDIPPAQLVA